MESSSKKQGSKASRGAADEGQVLAKAMSHSTRVRALIAMNSPRRRLSPTMFAKESGLRVQHCAYHFRVLERCGCIVLVATKQRRGGTEHLYEPRTTALAWTAEWKRFPTRLKRAIVTSVMREAVESLGSAIDSGTFEARDDSHLSWDTSDLDLEGWSEMAAVFDRALAELLQVEKGCRKRISKGADYFLASYFMSCFESPGKAAPQSDIDLGAKPAPKRRRSTKNKRRLKRQRARSQLNEQELMAKAMSHPTRVRILMAMNTPRRRLSPVQFSKETGLPLYHCSYHFSELDDCGCIELMSTRKRRGATEHFYEARKAALQWTEDWRHLGPVIKQSMLASVMRGAVEALGSAIDGGTFEARDDSHLACSTMKVDEQGWREMIAIFDRALAEQMKVCDEAATRIEAGAEAFLSTYFMASFESPEEAASLG